MMRFLARESFNKAGDLWNTLKVNTWGIQKYVIALCVGDTLTRGMFLSVFSHNCHLTGKSDILTSIIILDGCQRSYIGTSVYVLKRACFMPQKFR